MGIIHWYDHSIYKEASSQFETYIKESQGLRSYGEEVTMTYFTVV